MLEYNLLEPYKPWLGDNGYCFMPFSEKLDLEKEEYGMLLFDTAYVRKDIKLLSNKLILIRFSEGFWWDIKI